MNSQTQRKWNRAKLTVPTALIVQYAPAKALAEDTASNILNCTGSAREASSQETSYGPYWNYTVHPCQPSTLAIWTTGYEIRYARTPPHAGSCNNYTVPKPSCSYTIITLRKANHHHVLYLDSLNLRYPALEEDFTHF